jgi:hypothetical protein
LAESIEFRRPGRRRTKGTISAAVVMEMAVIRTVEDRVGQRRYRKRIVMNGNEWYSNECFGPLLLELDDRLEHRRYAILRREARPMPNRENEAQFAISLRPDRDGFLRRNGSACGREFKTEINDADLQWEMASQCRRLRVSIGDESHEEPAQIPNQIR